MGFPLLQKPGEMCVDRQIGVSGKFWNLNRGHMSEEEVTTLFKCGSGNATISYVNA
jgi:hypothetical protein